MVLVLAVVAALATMPSVRGQVSNVSCASGFEWMDNDIGQNPCLVTSYLISVCSPQKPLSVNTSLTGAYPIPGLNDFPANSCTCSTVPYMTQSACAACQKLGYPPWDAWKSLCDPSNISVAKLALGVPQGTQVPAWAFINPFDKGFDPNIAMVFARENNTDILPPSEPTSVSSALPSIPSSDQTPIPVQKKNGTPVGAIVGGVIGGIAAIVIGSLAVWYILRVMRNNPIRDPPMRTTPGHKAGPSYGSERSLWPGSDGTTSPPTTFGSPPVTQPLRLYDPDDPTTFPPPIRKVTIQ